MPTPPPKKTLVQCSNCPRWRPAEDYIGARGKPVKRCAKCREKDAKQKKKPEVREKSNQRQRERQYYKAYRARKREEDETAFLAHNAEVMRTWVSGHKEHLKAYRAKNLAARLGGIKRQARLKGYVFELDDSTCEAMMKSSCFYCGYQGSALNGIDRMDSRAHYTAGNCVPCCKTCNFMKTSLDAVTFVERCRQVSACHGGSGERHDEAWTGMKGCSFGAYKGRATKKNLPFELTLQQFKDLRGGSCVYCGRANTTTHLNGIDRMDNSLGYVVENCVTCCGQCNQSKRALGHAEFIQQCKDVARRAPDVPTMPRQLSVILARAPTRAP